MWDWYNRPGGRAQLSTRTLAIVLVVAGVLIGVFFVTLFTILAPLLFSRGPG